MRPDPRCALNAHNRQKDRSHERLGRQAGNPEQGSAFVDISLDKERFTSGLPVTRPAIGELCSPSQCCAGVLTLTAVDGGFHVRMEAPAVLACSFHRRTFTPITRSHSIANPSTMRAEARL